MNPTVQQLVDALSGLLPYVPGGLNEDEAGRPWLTSARAAIASAPSIPTWRPITEEDKEKNAILTEQGWAAWKSDVDGHVPGWFLSHDCAVLVVDQDGPFRIFPKFTITPPSL